MAETGAWRLFVALDLPEDVRAELGGLIERLRDRLPRDVRWVPAENLHLTLKFLGNISPERAGAIAERLGAQVPDLLPVDIALTGLGVFPGWAAPRVLWVGLGGDLAELGRLQQAVEEELAGLGFPAERRAFRPHLTIGRVRDAATPEARRRIGEGIRRASAAPRSFPAGTVHLMRSQLSPAGASYQPIATWVSRFLANP